MVIDLFCFEDDRKQWGDWQTGFFTPLVKRVLAGIGRQQVQVRLLLAHQVEATVSWGYYFESASAPPQPCPLVFKAWGTLFSCNAAGGAVNWAKEEQHKDFFLVVPWPGGVRDVAFGPHMIVADVIGPDNTDEPWRSIQRWARAVAYPWDMVWSATAHAVPSHTYGLGLPKFWPNHGGAHHLDPLIGFAADRLIARSRSEKRGEFYYTEYPWESLRPEIVKSIYKAITGRRWRRPRQWLLVDSWADVAGQLSRSAGAGSRTLFVVSDFPVPAHNAEAVDAYSEFLKGSIFAIPRRELLDPQLGLSPDALWLLMKEFCGALADGRFAEFRSYYIALRTLVPELTNDWLQPIARLRPETRPVHEKLNSSRLSTLYDPMLRRPDASRGTTLADIYRRFARAAGLPQGQARARARTPSGSGARRARGGP